MIEFIDIKGMKVLKKVNYSEYEVKYNKSIKERLDKDPENVDVEMMRANLYGYTYTKAMI